MRRMRGVEAALVVDAEHDLGALNADNRHTARIRDAGRAALISSKAHKLYERQRTDAASPKDAYDVYRLLVATETLALAGTIRLLLLLLLLAGRLPPLQPARHSRISRSLSGLPRLSRIPPGRPGRERDQRTRHRRGPRSALIELSSAQASETPRTSNRGAARRSRTFYCHWDCH